MPVSNEINAALPTSAMAVGHLTPRWAGGRTVDVRVDVSVSIVIAGRRWVAAAAMAGKGGREATAGIGRGGTASAAEHRRRGPASHASGYAGASRRNRGGAPEVLRGVSFARSQIAIPLFAAILRQFSTER